MRFSSAAASAFLALSCINIPNQVEAFSVVQRNPIQVQVQQQRNTHAVFGASSRKRLHVLFSEESDSEKSESITVNGKEEKEEHLTSKLDEVVAEIIKEDEEKEEVEAEAEAEAEKPLVLEPVPPASYSIETSNTGPNGGKVSTLTVHLGAPGHPEPIVIETGKIGRQAAGAVLLSRGDTIVYATASRDKDPKEKIDFLPLSVDHQERFSSAGLTSGSYNKRDGRPAEHEVLTCRLIDRPLRPLIADGWRHETQLLSWVMSYDGERSCDPLAITASSAALWISDVPLPKPVAAAMVGYIDGQFVLNPTIEQMEKSKLNLTVAGTKDAVLMIEGAADFLTEEQMIEAVSFGHNAIKVLCEALEEFGELVGKEKNYSTLPTPIEGLEEEVVEALGTKVEDLWNEEGKKENLSASMSALSKEAWAMFEEKYPDNRNEVMGNYKKLLSKKMYEKAKATGTRCDGRKLDEVRNIDIETSLLPKVHGSALFTRGETQAIATATLGDSGMKQKIDKIDGLTKKRFYLQYTFPPSCVGETGRVGAPGRREIGHGNLAERALEATIPSEEEFPYSIRVESLITESNGSSSMASVCGGCLALMDSGVPIKNPVAGIAMGMLLDDTHSVSDENAVIVSDILGTEDGLGTMDFKVAGDRTGISTFQLDIKCEGLTIETMSRALQQAKEGRLHILDKMEASLAAPRAELPDTIPRINTFNISSDSIGRVIGPGGKQIRAIIEDFELVNMDVQEDGTIQLSSLKTDKLEQAQKFVEDLVKGGGGGGGRGGGREKKAPYAGPEPVEGEVYKGKITGIHQFGVFVEILPGAEDGSYPGLEGLCHVSELHTERVRNCEGFMNSMGIEEMEVKYLGKNNKGKLQLSRKAVLEDKRNGNKKTPKTPKAEMSKEEVDVIAQAIEGIKNL